MNYSEISTDDLLSLRSLIDDILKSRFADETEKIIPIIPEHSDVFDLIEKMQ